MAAFRPITPDNLRRKLPPSTNDMQNVADNRRGTLEAVFVLSKLLLGDDLARFQRDALDPITHVQAYLSDGPIQCRNGSSPLKSNPPNPFQCWIYSDLPLGWKTSHSFTPRTPRLTRSRAGPVAVAQVSRRGPATVVILSRARRARVAHLSRPSPKPVASQSLPGRLRPKPPHLRQLRQTPRLTPPRK